MFTDPLALGLKGRVDPGAAIGPSRRGVDDPNLGDQPSMFGRAGTLGPSGPGIVAGGGYRQEATPPPHRHTAHMGMNGATPHDDGLAKYAATRCKQSRSCVTRVNSRLSRASSSSWGLRRPLPGKAATVSPAISYFQRRNRFGVIPSSQATCAVG